MPDELRKRTRTILDTALDAFIEVNSGQQITEWNAQAEKSFGWTHSEVVGKELTHLFAPATHAQVHALLLSVAENPAGAQQLETTALRRDGHQFPVKLSVSCIPSGQDYSLAIFACDLSQEKQWQEQLFDSQERYQAILDGIGDGYNEADIEGRYVFINAAFCRIFGQVREHQERLNLKYFTTPEEAIGKNFREYTPPESVEEVIQKYMEVYRTGKPATHEFNFTVGSRTFFIEQSVALKKDREGRRVGWRVVSRDCTERKLREQELARAKEVVEAARQAADEAKVIAEKANRSKSEFLANMSHEIRTPLNAIMGMTELVLGTDLSEEQREFLVMAKSAADSLLNVINDILDYSKIEASKLVLDPQAFNLEDLVADSAKILAVAAHRKGLELAFHVQPDIPRALIGDANRLRQVMINLIGNAIKFTEQGEVVLRVQMKDSSEKGAELHFSVRDTGMGIPAEKQYKLFHAFEQADASTTRQYGGTGLGLAISSRLVQLMGGHMWLESSAAAGSTFHFIVQLPLAPEGAKEMLLSGTEELRELPVLIVDDNRTHRDILCELMRLWRMRPEEADSGPAGLIKLHEALEANRPFRLILLDEEMPGINGAETLDRIRAHSAFKLPAIVMLNTAYPAAAKTRRHELDACWRVTKPIKPAELLTTIRKALQIADPALPPAANAPRESKHHPEGLRILLAEDNVINQKLALAMLGKMGHQVTSVTSGTEAVAARHQGRYDLLLMDVQMPEMDGFEATSRIREQERVTGAHIPIVAMTANAMSGDREACLQAGMDDYISKPINRKELEQVIARVLQKVL